MDILSIIFPLSITLAFETGIYMILKHKDLKLFIVVSVLNVLLNPTMNIGLSFIGDRTLYQIILLICEVATIFIESIVIYLFMKIKYPKVLFFAFIANVLSFLIGTELWYIFQNKIALIIISAILLAVYLTIFIVILLYSFSSLTPDSKRDDNSSGNS